MFQKQASMEGTIYYIPQYLWDVITCRSHWYLLLAHKSSYEVISEVTPWGVIRLITGLFCLPSNILSMMILTKFSRASLALMRLSIKLIRRIILSMSEIAMLVCRAGVISGPYSLSFALVIGSVVIVDDAGCTVDCKLARCFADMRITSRRSMHGKKPENKRKAVNDKYTAKTFQGKWIWTCPMKNSTHSKH